MTEHVTRDLYLRKAEESLRSAEHDLADERPNSCANRCYYACFQSAIAALLGTGISPAKAQWGHEFVQAQFVGQLINRRHRYPTELRTVLADLMRLRQQADYEPDPVTRTQAERALRRCRVFLEAVRSGGDPSQ